METTIKKRKRKKIRQLVGVFLCLFIFHISTTSFAASGGSVEILLKEGTVVSYAQVGRYDGGRFILQEPYDKSKIIPNNLQYAKETQQAIRELMKYVKSDGKLVANADGIARLENMEEGIYLFYSEETKNGTICPSLVKIPTWDEEQNLMNYNIQFIPKYTVKRIAPETSNRHGIGIYLGLAIISLIIAFLSCHKRFRYGIISNHILAQGGCLHGNDNDTKNPCCARRIRHRRGRTVDRSKVRCSHGK